MKWIVAEGRWLPLLLVRMVVGFVFIQAGLNQLQNLNHTKDVLSFFWIAVPAGHRLDPFFPLVEIICGMFVLMGLLTRVAAASLFGVMIAAVVSTKFKELAGLNLSVLRELTMIALLVWLCAAGAGSASIDRFIFKSNASRSD